MRARRLAFWGLFALMSAVYATMVFWSLPRLSAMAGGVQMFDLRPMGYSFDEAQAILAALGDVGIQFYVQVQHKLDTVYPALLALTLIWAFQALFRRRAAQVLSVLAAGAAACDYSENARVATMLKAGADGIDNAMVEAASFWTIAKSGLTTIALIALLVGMVLWLWNRWAANRPT